ncbi:hypothetical protein ACVW0P_001126 [Mucilaginibacter sp. UYNi724]
MRFQIYDFRYTFFRQSAVRPFTCTNIGDSIRTIGKPTLLLLLPGSPAMRLYCTGLSHKAGIRPYQV